MGAGVLTAVGEEGRLPSGFERVDGALTCRGVALEEVAARFGTPLYVYDVAGVEARVRRFQRAFSGIEFLLAYAAKANGSLALLNRIAALGAGADIVSHGELFRALRAGVPADRIVFAGVGKREEELVAGLEAGILAFHVESAGELALLAEVAGRMGKSAPLSLRVNPDIDSPTPHAYTRTGHAASKFGIPLGEAEALYREHFGDPRLDFRGIAVHIGSQIVEPEPYLNALDAVLGIVDRLTADGLTLGYLDLGGGFGVGYDGEEGFDLDRLTEAVTSRLLPRGLRLILEPGRAIVGESGILLTRVLFVKQAGGKTFVVTDGGMTELLRPSHYGGFHRIVPVRDRAGAPAVVSDIVGPICETGDFLALDRPLPLPEPGD
ncbi:MAG: diaminopimelate decarboxylase, partial [Gemmatimonadota bacterium]